MSAARIASRRRGERALPPLAPDEELLWQGHPRWRSVACRVFHIRAVGAYFAALTLVDMAITRIYEGGGWPVAAAAAPTAISGALCLSVLAGLAWATERTTNYVLTTRRVVLQFGLALPATLAVPLHRIAAASLKVRDDHTGDISLRLKPGEAVMFAKIWPHVRPWRFFGAEPMLRDIPRAGLVAPLLCRTLASQCRAAPAIPREAIGTADAKCA